MDDGERGDAENMSLASLVEARASEGSEAIAGRDKTLPHHLGPSQKDLPPQVFKPLTTLDKLTVLPQRHDTKPQRQIPLLRLTERLRYKTKRPLGRGATGLVELARDQDIGRPVALKKLRHSSDPEAVARLVDEIRIVGQLEHPNIVPIHDVGLTKEGDYYFVMRFVDGLTLQQVIQGLRDGDSDLHRRFSFEARVRVFREILSAVAFAHDHGVIHRDLKPENIMIGSKEEVFVMDWGLANCSGEGEFADKFQSKMRRAAALDSEMGMLRSAVTTSSPRLDLIQGTPMYMAPEQLTGESRKESDVYTLGVIFHEFLCLNHYLRHKRDLAATFKGVREDSPLPAFQFRNPNQGRVPIEWSHFVTRTVRKDHLHRFNSAREMLTAFNKVDDGRFPIQCPTSFTKRCLTVLTQGVDRYPVASYVVLLSILFSFFYQLTAELLY